jgi:hypothetical protein
VVAVVRTVAAAVVAADTADIDQAVTKMAQKLNDCCALFPDID